MRFSNFLFPESRDPAGDGVVLDEVMAEVRLCEQLGFDTVWLSEHHFDGTCAYVDLVAFAAALAVATTRIRIGLAVPQMSLHHPVRLAEQLALIDHLSKGRLIVGLGRGTAYNIYEYQGYGIDPAEAHDRFEEAVEIMHAAWASDTGLDHRGRFWQLRAPPLRPRPFTRPHPLTIHAAAGEASLLELGRRGEPFLMNVQGLETTRRRIAAWQEAGRDAGIAEDRMAASLDQSWIWRNVFVAETDAEAERIAVPAFTAMVEHRTATRRRVMAEQGVTLSDPNAKPAHADVRHALLYGSPATVAEQIAELEATGAGGAILQFRLGPMRYADAARSLGLFMAQVVPRTGLQRAA